MLPIVAASTVQFRRGGLQMAGLSTILFFGVVVAQYLDAGGYLELPFEPRHRTELPPVYVAQYIVALNAFGLFVVALLSGSLAERARRGEARLEQATEEIADLQAFNQYVLDNLLSGLATADADNRLVTFNRSAMVITGRSGALPIGESAADVLQLPAAFAANLSHDLARVRSKRIDYMLSAADGDVDRTRLERRRRCRCPTARAATSTPSRTSPTSSATNRTRGCSSAWRRSVKWRPASRTRSAIRWRRCRARCRC